MTPGEISVLADLTRRRSGVVIDSDKSYIIESRLAPIARKQGFITLSELVSDLQQRKDETLIWATVEALASTETQFFRDRSPFQQIATGVLPALARKGRQTVNAWCAGCSTGQEPYSLAILAEEERGKHGPMSLDILATDISERSLEKAAAGIYTQFEVQRGLPSRLLVKYFDKVDENWVLQGRIRQAVRTQRQNLLTDVKGSGPFDLILCRNVVSAFDPAVARQVLEQISGALAPDGYLVMGAYETSAHHSPCFRAVPGLRGLYTRDPNHRAAA
ncbi:MAG TPA: protein-glutamate O-methyltransferase CheR [Caulobacteraceae bacterium]